MAVTCGTIDLLWDQERTLFSMIMYMSHFFFVDDAIRLRAREGFRLKHSIILAKVGMRLFLSRSMVYLLNILPSLVGQGFLAS
jgi:hypothetical protein